MALALVDAGIPMKDIVCSCSVMLAENIPLVDSNYLEESSSNPQVVVAILPKLDQQMVFSSVSGRLHEDHLSLALDAASKSCCDIQRLLDRNVRDHVSNILTNRGPE